MNEHVRTGQPLEPDVSLRDFVVFDSSLGTELNGAALKRKSRLREWIESLTFTIIFVLIFTNFIAQATQVPTESMKPTIMVGDHFFLDKFAFVANYPEFVWSYLPQRDVERGDIIAFRSPTQGDIPFVKRLIALPGDTKGMSP